MSLTNPFSPNVEANCEGSGTDAPPAPSPKSAGTKENCNVSRDEAEGAEVGPENTEGASSTHAVVLQFRELENVLSQIASHRGSETELASEKHWSPKSLNDRMLQAREELESQRHALSVANSVAVVKTSPTASTQNQGVVGGPTSNADGVSDEDSRMAVSLLKAVQSGIEALAQYMRGELHPPPVYEVVDRDAPRPLRALAELESMARAMSTQLIDRDVQLDVLGLELRKVRMHLEARPVGMSGGGKSPPRNHSLEKPVVLDRSGAIHNLSQVAHLSHSMRAIAPRFKNIESGKSLALASKCLDQELKALQQKVDEDTTLHVSSFATAINQVQRQVGELEKAFALDVWDLMEDADEALQQDVALLLKGAFDRAIVDSDDDETTTLHSTARNPTTVQPSAQPVESYELASDGSDGDGVWNSKGEWVASPIMSNRSREATGSSNSQVREMPSHDGNRSQQQPRPQQPQPNRSMEMSNSRTAVDDATTPHTYGLESPPLGNSPPLRAQLPLSSSQYRDDSQGSIGLDASSHSDIYSHGADPFKAQQLQPQSTLLSASALEPQHSGRQNRNKKEAHHHHHHHQQQQRQRQRQRQQQQQQQTTAKTTPRRNLYSVPNGDGDGNGGLLHARPMNHSGPDSKGVRKGNESLVGRRAAAQRVIAKADRLMLAVNRGQAKLGYPPVESEERKHIPHNHGGKGSVLDNVAAELGVPVSCTRHIASTLGEKPSPTVAWRSIVPETNDSTNEAGKSVSFASSGRSGGGRGGYSSKRNDVGTAWGSPRSNSNLTVPAEFEANNSYLRAYVTEVVRTKQQPKSRAEARFERKGFLQPTFASTRAVKSAVSPHLHPDLSSPRSPV